MKLCCAPLIWPTSLQSRGTTVYIHSALAVSLWGKKRCHSSPEGWAMSQVDFRFRCMPTSNVPSSTPVHLYRCLSGRTDRKKNFSIPYSRWTTSEWSPNLCRSSRRHPKCHCSWNTVKCFCSCRCPLKILAASMTAVKISQALPFTCQQGLKIVQVGSAGHCLAYFKLCNKNPRRRTSFWSQNTYNLWQPKQSHLLQWTLASMQVLFVTEIVTFKQKGLPDGAFLIDWKNKKENCKLILF